MKTIAVVVFAVLFALRGRAQEIVSVPAFPQDNSTVTITVNCNLGNQGLLGAGGTGVYAYMGLITDSSTSSSDWRYVPAACQWGTPNPAVAATYLGNNQYSFTIPNIRTYFGVPAAEVIYKVAILFWGDNGNLAQRNADASNMYVPIYTTSLAGQFTLPPFQPTYTPIPQPLSESVGDTLPVKFVTNQAANLNLYVNGVSVASATSADSLQFTMHVTATDRKSVV